LTSDYTTIAYSAVTGARLWVSRYNGSANGYDYATTVVVSPDGRTVYVTGHAVSGVSSDGVKTYGFGTIAYNAATGARLWVSIYAPAHGSAIPGAIGISPDGTRIFVTGMSDPAEREHRRLRRRDRRSALGELEPRRIRPDDLAGGQPRRRHGVRLRIRRWPATSAGS
jgi:DNA-binding beta-propeller fold protein YncE